MIGRRATGGQAAACALRDVGVRRVFGIPGVLDVEFFDAMAGIGVEVVQVTHEHSAAVMADAHARATGGLGAFAVTAGPGMTNALTGLAEARADSVPVLGIITSAGGPERKGQIHEMDQTSVLEATVKEVFQPASPEAIREAIHRAARCAVRGEPGPVVVEIPSDWMWATSIDNANPFSKEVPSHVPEGELDEIAAHLRRSPSVGIYAGAGAMDACRELLALAEILQAPVSTTICGRGVIPEDHPLSVGCGFGASGTTMARKVFSTVHTLLAIGCRFSQAATGSSGFKMPPHLIHVDANPEVVGAHYHAELGLESDAGVALKGLVSRLRGDSKPEAMEMRAMIRRWKESHQNKIMEASNRTGRVHPARLLRSLRKALPWEAILATDCGNHQFWALTEFPVLAPRTFLSPADFQAMGYAIPAAISAKLAFPDRTVACVVGDGGFLMGGMELVTAASRGLSVLVVIFRDGSLGLIREVQMRLYGRPVATDLRLPNLALIAEAFGARYLKISQDAEIDEVLGRALALRGTVIVDACVSYREPSPYVRGAALSYFRRAPHRTQRVLAMRVAGRILRAPLSITGHASDRIDKGG